MLNTLAWQHVSRRIGARWSGELRIEKSHLQRSSLSADLRPQRSASTSERGWLPQPRSHAVARTPYSSPHFGPSRRSDLSQNGYSATRNTEHSHLQNLVISRNNRSKTFPRLRQANMICPGPSEICPAPFLSLSKHTREETKINAPEKRRT